MGRGAEELGKLGAEVNLGRRWEMKEEEAVERESHVCLCDRRSNLLQRGGGAGVRPLLLRTT